MDTTVFWALIILVMVGGGIVQMVLQSRFKRYSQVRLSSGMTGREVAEKMLLSLIHI